MQGVARELHTGILIVLKIVYALTDMNKCYDEANLITKVLHNTGWSAYFILIISVKSVEPFCTFS